MKTSIFTLKFWGGFCAGIALLLLLLCGCRSSGSNSTPESSYSNPIFSSHENTSISLHEGLYYYVINLDGKILLYVNDDPTKFEETAPHVACYVQRDHGLIHLWHPQIVNLDGKWYIYFTGDNGNTDDHQLYVIENTESDPREGTFVMRGRISTDKDDNWAIHAHVFEHNEELYMLWSGWDSRRVFVETQCIFIAKMRDPYTLSSERVKISEPEYEWERQWVNVDGAKTAYPVYVNEAPFFFANEKTDKLYIYYSASAMWTSYCAIGELSAEKSSNLLDPLSWKKRSKPVFSQNVENGVFGPGYPYIIPSPDGSEYYMVYMARERAEDPYSNNAKTVRMQKIDFSAEGSPDFGIAEPLSKAFTSPWGGEIKLER